MAKLVIGKANCKITYEQDINFLWSLDRELSFKVQGAEYTMAFKKNAWDGRKRLLTDSLVFPSGLKDRVLDFYKRAGKEIEIEDYRPAKEHGKQIEIMQNLKDMGKEPYPYQLNILNYTRLYDRGIIRAATGSGKTICSALITADIGKNTIIYVIGKDLLHQIHNLYEQVFKGIKIGKIGDGICEIGDINIASVWTLGEALGFKPGVERADEKKITADKYAAIKDALRSAKVHIFDECHISPCDTIQNIANNINPEHLYGMSASPWRDSGDDLLLEGFLGKKIVDISASTLIEQGYLVQPIIKFRHVPKFHERLKRNYNTIYKNYIVENDVRNYMIANETEKLVNLGYKTLVLFQSINHGNIIYEKISERLPCILLSGKDDSKTREDAKKKMENGEINCIVASSIFDIGVDIPIASGLVLAGSGKSSIRALQRIGRVIRKYPGKKNAAVVDFADSAAYVKQHAEERYKIYSIEEKFKISWPKK